MKDPELMSRAELIEEIKERRAYDETLEPVLQEIGERMEQLESTQGIQYIGDTDDASR